MLQRLRRQRDAARERLQTLLAITSRNLTDAELREFDDLTGNGPTAVSTLDAMVVVAERAEADELDRDEQHDAASRTDDARRAQLLAGSAARSGQTGDRNEHPNDRPGAQRGAGPVSGSRSGSGRGLFVRTSDRQPAAVERGARFDDHPVAAAYRAQMAAADAAVVGQHGGIGNLVRSMTTSSGSAVVPTVWAADIIDRARNAAAVLQAGASLVPMDAKTVQIGRLTGDPTAAFRTEGSTITASDPVFDNVTLTATTMSALVVGSLEWFMDSDNVDNVVAEAISQAIALQLDLVALYGGITTGAGAINLPTPPNPRGVLAALLAVASSSVLGGATNGTTQTALSYWNEIIDTIFTVRSFNESPTGLIWSSKAAQQYAKAYDSTGQPLAVPPAVGELDRFISNQSPSYTQGTMTSRATDVFVGDWSQLLIGQRLGLTVQTLTERYAENGQIGIVAHWRGDVQPARPRAFAVYRAIQGA